MFEVYYTKKKNCYLLKSIHDKFYVTIRKTLGYPKKAKRPYKGTVWLIKNNKFILLRMSDASTRQLYSAIMDRLTQFIQRQEEIEASSKEQYSLLEQNLDDIVY